MSTSGGVTVSKLDLQTYTNEFESHWAPHSFGLVPHWSKELCKLLLYISWDLLKYILIQSLFYMSFVSLMQKD